MYLETVRKHGLTMHEISYIGTRCDVLGATVDGETGVFRATSGRYHVIRAMLRWLTERPRLTGKPSRRLSDTLCFSV